MKFDIHITKTGNFFHFLMNLTEFHHSCRKQDNKQWLFITGELTKKEKESLKEFKKLLRNYGYQGKYFLGIPFITSSEKEVWKKVKKWVKPDEFKKLKNIFKTFSPRFEKIWRMEGMKLNAWQKELKKTLQSKVKKRIFTDFKKFFKTEKHLGEIHIYLLISADSYRSGGGANLRKGEITLECSSTSRDQINSILITVYHEIAHLFQGEYNENLIRDFLQKKGKEIKKTPIVKKYKIAPRSVISEGIVASIIAGGYLDEKYLGKKIRKKPYPQFIWEIKEKKTSFGLWYRFIGYKMFKTAKKYIEGKKPVDKEYINKVYNYYLEYLKI